MMKNYLLLLSCAALFSCSNEAPESTRELTMEEKLAKIKAEDTEDCTTIEPEVVENLTGRVSYKEKYWGAGQTLKIKFLNGEKYKQDSVKKYANEWTKYANLKFEWVASNYHLAHIKIAFNPGGNWSKVGHDSEDVPQNEPSMNFGSLNRSSTDWDWSRSVLHEFGHALGLAHEHKHPLTNFKWDLEFVYYYYKIKLGWNKSMVDQQVINKFSVKDVDYDAYDGKSIMMYSIPSGLILDYISFSKTYKLSDGDKKSIAVIYPPSEEN